MEMNTCKFYAKNLCLLILLVAFHQIANAKTYSASENLKWNESATKVIFGETSTEAVYLFNGAVFDVDYDGLPHFHKMYAVDVFGQPSVTLQNEVYVSIDPSILNNFQTEQIGKEVIIEAQGEKSANEAFASVKIFPFRKNGLTIERLASFDITIKNTAVDLRSVSTNSYVNSSKLATGSWYKINAPKQGVYKLDMAFMQEAGIDMNALELDKIKLYTYPGGMLPQANEANNPDDLNETPIQITDQNNNNRLDEGDLVIFYSAGANVWKYENENYKHQNHHYSYDYFAFMRTDGELGKRVSSVNNTGNATYTSNNYDILRTHELDTNSVVKSGKGWLGELFEFVDEYDFNFSLPGLQTTEPIAITTKVYGRSTVSSSQFQVFVNNNLFQTHTVNKIGVNYYDKQANESEMTNDFTSNSENINIKIKYLLPDNGASGWLDYITLQGRAKLNYSAPIGQFVFSDKNAIGNPVSQFNIEGNGFTLWDVSDIYNIKTPQLSNGTFKSNTENFKQFAVFSNNDLYAATYVESIPNQNLHFTDQHDMLIISHQNFTADAERLADFHRNEGLSVFVASPKEIFNEYSNGVQDVSAMRNFVRMFYQRANNLDAAKPKFLLLFGDGSFDYKNIEFTEAENTNYVPTYESDKFIEPLSSFCTDDFFTLMDQNEGDNVNAVGLPDIAVGRIPCTTVEEAKDAVDKIIYYKSEPSKGDWLNTFTLLADDQDGDLHFKHAEGHATNINNQHPDYNIDKIYCDAFEQENTTAGARYPEVNDAILRRVFQGAFAINYVGHGGENGWAHERILQFSDIDDWNFPEKQPLLITATCSFSRYDNPGKFSAGEAVTLKGDGGCIANITTCRVVYASENKALNEALVDTLLDVSNQQNLPIGEAVRLAKQRVGANVNARKFALLGDPALVLNYPKYKIVTTKVNGISVAQATDTLTALSSVNIEGEIQDFTGSRLNDFNGTLTTTIFDKVEIKNTLGNDAGSSILPFESQSNRLFKGKSSVNNGTFSFNFIVPKDIQFRFDYGKISYYAKTSTGLDANGFDNSVVIGGISDNAATDNVKPEIQLFMNDENFVFGGTTDENPVLYAKLFDDSGINTVGTGIGHDLTAVLDANEKDAIILNDFYEADIDNYKAGSIRYPLSRLSEGKHSLTVTVWDVHNNWNSAYIEFFVIKGEVMSVTNVLNYPNPFTTNTEFHFEHNRPNADLSAQVNIFTLSGTLIKTIQGVLPSSVYRVKNLTWDGLDSYGNRIGRGTYIYRVTIFDGDEKITSDFQKLVLLR